MQAPIRFGNAELRPPERALLLDGQPAAVGARAFDVLLTLVEHRDRVVPKSELFDRVWPGLVVEENNLQVQISALRKLLGPQAIATIPGRGYRFSAALEGAPTASPALPGAGAESGSRPARPLTNLPAELPHLFGRAADLQALCALVDSHRLVTVVGAGGIGKSRLAQAAAHARADRWPDGAWMVELAGLSDPALVPSAVSQVLHVALAGKGATQDELVGALAQRNLLLVLDNCEHLLDTTAALAQAIADGAPNVTLLTTSQEPLHVPGEQQYRLMPLAVPAQVEQGHAQEFGALALFEARVQAADPRFALNEEVLPLVIDICRRLDGLPLAIELAAARVASLGLRPLRDKLDARFKLLTGGARTTLRRHQTLRAALEWSHNLLNDSERAVFRRLGVFAGGFTMELAQAVAGDATLDEWSVLDVLSALVDKSLVVVEGGEAPRYRLLESARAFALEQLADGETAEMLRRHALAMRDFLVRVDDTNLEGELRTDQYAALVVPETDNLRAAYAWASAEGGDPRIAIALAAHSGSLIDYAAECANWLLPWRQTVEEGGVEDAIAARYWRALAAGNMSGRAPVALQADAARRAHDLYRTLGKPRRVYASLIRLAQSLGGHDAEGARAALDEARRLLKPDWPPEFRIVLMRRDGARAREAGRFDEALALYRECVRASAAAGDWRLEVIARNNVIDLLWEAGPVEEAAREACALAEELRARPAADGDTDTLYANVIGTLSELGRIDEASAAARIGMAIMRRTQSYYFEEWIHLFWKRGQVEAAALMLGAFEAQSRLTGVKPQVNERRLLAEAQPALAAQLAPDALANLKAAGAALSKVEIGALIAETLAQERQQARA